MFVGLVPALGRVLCLCLVGIHLRMVEGVWVPAVPRAIPRKGSCNVRRVARRVYGNSLELEANS